MIKWFTIFTVLLFSNQLLAVDEKSILEMISSLQERVSVLEEKIKANEGGERWKKAYLWNQLQKDMHASEVKSILGTPSRIDQQIFETWYYHPTSKLHSFIWLDEDKVLGWKLPE